MTRWLPFIILLTCVLLACSGRSSDDASPSVVTEDTTESPIATATVPSMSVPTPSPAANATIAPGPGASATSYTTAPFTPTVTATAIPAPSPDDLADALRGGGYVIYFRHAMTDRNQIDTASADLADCSTQRNLIDAGRAQARSIGVAFQQLGIPVGDVMASRYCRTLETARLAFGEPQPGDDITGLPSISGDERQRRMEALRALLATKPAEGTNTVLVSHNFTVLEAADVDLTEEGQAAIFQPTDDGFDLVRTVLAEEWLALATSVNGPRYQEYAIPDGSNPHDVAPANDGTVFYTAQGSGELGRLDPVTGAVHKIPLGAGSSPHGVIVGPDGAAWVTDSGLNAMVRVDAVTEEVRAFPLPPEWPDANLNTATFAKGDLWFTGQSGVYGRLDPQTGEMQVYDAPGDRGPYGITATHAGTIYYASLAGSHIARIDQATGAATVLEPPTVGQGARRVWADSNGSIWVSEWNVGQVARYDPAADAWQEWKLPGTMPQAYAVYVDDRDIVWLSDFPNNVLVSFDPATEAFESFPLPSAPSNVRQILGRPHEVWGAQSGVNKLVVLRVP